MRVVGQGGRREARCRSADLDGKAEGREAAGLIRAERAKGPRPGRRCERKGRKAQGASPIRGKAGGGEAAMLMGCRAADATGFGESLPRSVFAGFALPSSKSGVDLAILVFGNLSP